jgi:hypothetical protein
MSSTRYYYIQEDAKQILHFSAEQKNTAEGMIFCGMSELPVKGAAGYYAKNQSGYTIVNGDELPEKPQDDQETTDIENERIDLPTD